MTVTTDSTADDGETGEKDNVNNDVENVIGGSGDDTISGAGDVANFFDGGLGNDALNGGPGNDFLFGDQGNDSLDGQTGGDDLDGGLGADTLSGSTGSDTADNSLRSEPVTASLDGASGNDGAAGEGDTIANDVENLTGGSGDDTLTGNDNPNVITGGDGGDTLSGLGGADTINAQDAFADTITCGSEDDTVNADKLDIIAGDCETVSFPPPPGSGGGGGAGNTTNPPAGNNNQNNSGNQPKNNQQNRSPSGRLLPRGLSVRVSPRRDRRAPYRFAVTGAVRIPSGVSRQTACGGGRVSVQVKTGKRTISTRRAAVDLRCRYRVTLTFANRRSLGGGRLTVTVRFLGSDRLRAFRAPPTTVRAG